jgi:hypothetical protein
MNTNENNGSPSVLLENDAKIEERFQNFDHILLDQHYGTFE